jgi:hypothetical protein
LTSSLLSKNPKIKIYRTTILPVVLCGCETLSLTLRKEEWLRVFESMMLRKFGQKMNVEKGKWRRLHNVDIMNCTPH